MQDKGFSLCRINTLKVGRVDNKGVWLEAGERLAHLPLREGGDAQPGETIEIFIYQDPTGELQATSRIPLAQAGEFALLTVRSVTVHGAFLDWGMPKDLLAPFALQPERMEVGKSYVVRVEVDQQGRPFANARIEECLDRGRPELREGDAVKLLVWQLTDLGAKVVVNDRYPGLLYRDELVPGTTVGVPLQGYVKRVRNDGKLDVSLRKVGVDGVADAREKILLALEQHGGRLPLNDDSPPEKIRTILGMSKKLFKKAVGGLYKDGLVKLEGESVIATGSAAGRIRH